MGQMRIIDQIIRLNAISDYDGQTTVRERFNGKKMLRKLICQLLDEGKQFSVKKKPFSLAFLKQRCKGYPMKKYAKSHLGWFPSSTEEYEFVAKPFDDRWVFIVSWKD
jgi:hypothetical protein